MSDDVDLTMGRYELTLDGMDGSFYKVWSHDHHMMMWQGTSCVTKNSERPQHDSISSYEKVFAALCSLLIQSMVILKCKLYRLGIERKSI